MSTETETATVLRIYEVGYHIVPTVKEEDVEKVVGSIRAEIEKAGGNFISEGAPSLMKLAYPMTTREGEKYIEHDRAFFGWIKFEASPEAAGALEAALKANVAIIRCLVFKTVREDTRAKYKAPTLREVKRTDTLKPTTRRTEETKEAPVSEEELDKALEELTVE
jgi:ribosomal protein S6